MLYREDGEWRLAPYKVKYKQHGETHEQYTNDKKWWNDFADKWEHTEIIEFKDAAYTDEQQERLEEVQSVKEGYEYYASRYVLDGLFPDELEEEEKLINHPMQLLQVKKEDEFLGQDVTESKIQDIEHGQKSTEFEIRLLELEAK